MAGPEARERRIAAILNGEFAGFERLTHLDRDSAVQSLEHDLEAIAEIIARHKGLKLVVRGQTNFIVAFPEATDAVSAGFEILALLGRRNADLPPTRHLKCRIGVESGEVVMAHDHLTGPAVTAAEGLRNLARPNTLLVTQTVFDLVKPTLRFAYRPVGERRLADDGEPVRAFQLKQMAPAYRRRLLDRRRLLERPLATAAVVALVLVLGGGAWYAYHNLAAAPSKPDVVATAAPDEPADEPAGETRSPAPDTPEDRAADSRTGTDGATPRADADGDRASEDVARTATSQQDAATTPSAVDGDRSERATEEETEVAALAVDGLSDQDRASASGNGDVADTDRPLLAVLRFAGLDDDTAGYFSTGVAEDLIRYLGRFPHLMVIDSDSSFAYGADGADVVAVSKDLGATHIVRGAATRDAGQLVIEARLFDARTGAALWPKPFASRSASPAALQQQLGQEILAGLEGREPKLEPAEFKGVQTTATQSLEAYDYALQWRELFDRSTRASNLRARQAAVRAVEIDPDYASAYAYVAWTFMADYWRGWAGDPERALDQALTWAQQAVDRGLSDFDAYWALGDVYQAMGAFEDAVAAYETALAINPNAADLLQDFGTWALPLQGRSGEGLELARRSMRLNPHHPEAYHGNMALNYYLLGRYEEVASAVNRMRAPRLDHLLYLAAAYAQMGRELEAKLTTVAALGVRPDITVDRVLASLPFRRDADAQHLREGLRAAGLPG